MKQQLSTYLKLGILGFSLAAAMLGLAMICGVGDHWRYYGALKSDPKLFWDIPRYVWGWLWFLLSADFVCVTLLFANHWIKWDKGNQES